MNSHFPLHNAIAYKPVPFKHHIAFNKCTSLNTSPKQTKKLEFCNPITSNVYLFRPSSVPVSRKHSQQICINNASQQSNQTQMCEDKVLEGVGLENKNHQNVQQPKLHIQRDKQTTKNELKNTQNSSNSHSINSVQKKVLFKEMIADVVNQQEKKDETKESNKPKVPSFIKKNSFAKNQNLNQMNLPLNHIQNSKTRNAHTDRHKQAFKEHVFHANIAVHHNEEIIRLSSLNKDKNLALLLKTEVEDKVNRGQPRKIRKQMTQDCILQGSHFHLQHRQISLPFKYQTQNKQRKNSHNQQKKKGSFQFFRKIKQKKLNSLHEHHHPKQFQLSDFSLIDKLGKGAFGDVFLAQQIVTGLICVIKKLSKKKIKQMKLESQVERQIKIQSFLNHRHITSLYCFFDDQAHIYLILQLLPDGTLMQSKYRRKIPQNQVSRIVRHIALGLSYLHTEKIIHRDLKPQNIFLFETYAKIGDFGCSIFTNTFRNSQIGSLAYVSPEQLKQQLYNQKIDVWSMGIIMYQMLLGVSPFQKDIIKIARKQMTAELLQLKFPQGAVLSNLAREFLMGVLNSDPKERLGIQQALKHEFIVKYMPKQLLNEKQSQ